MNFTSSPFERMMKEVPHPGWDNDAPCKGCRYYKECKGKKKQCRKKFRALIVESRPSLGQKCLSADRTGPQLRGDAFRCQRRLKLRVKGQDSLTEVTAVRPCPALVQHIAGTVKRKAQAAFPVIVGAHPRDQRTDFLLLVTGQLPGVHL